MSNEVPQFLSQLDGSQRRPTRLEQVLGLTPRDIKGRFRARVAVKDGQIGRELEAGIGSLWRTTALLDQHVGARAATCTDEMYIYKQTELIWVRRDAPYTHTP
jgi:hypothetical protein